MGLLDLFKGKFVDPTYPGVHAGGDVITTTLDAVVKWGRRSSIWPMPFGTACCAIEFMALSASHYDLARFGAEVLRFSPRQADLMFVAGTIPDKLAPVLKTIYDQMPEPKWVISMGVCASSGGFYRSYHVMQGIDEIIPVDVYVPGCPPSPEGLIAAVMKIQERIKNGEQAKEPQGAHRVGAQGAGAIDRRARRAGVGEGRRRAPRPRASRRGASSSCGSSRRPPRTSTMASATAAATARGPRQARRPRPRARRSATPSCACDDFRGDLAITVAPQGLGRGRAPPPRPPRARLQALPRPVRRRLPRPGRSATSASRSCCTSTRSRRSTTSA